MASKRIRRTKSFQGYVAGVTSDLSTVKNRNVSTSIAARAIDGGAFSEEVEIVDKSLQSSNYLEGEDGWKIDGSGNAEFGNVYVRGDINAETGTIGYWNISTPAVTRTFGGTKLYGTFLESADLGYSDTEVDTGTYVSLFKSFVGNPIVFESVNLTSDIVTVTSTGHYLLVGDNITTYYDDAALEANLSSATYVTITGITEDTFSYAKPVANNYDGLNDVATTAISGYGEIYNEDISGLYLRDYAKNLFDYAYISNKGMAYVGASKLNLVYNPSFEYRSTGTITAVTANGTAATYTYTANNAFTTGGTITVTGITPTDLNLSDVNITTANSTSFRVSSSQNTGITPYVSGGTATSTTFSSSGWTYNSANLTAWDFATTARPAFRDFTEWGATVGWVYSGLTLPIVGTVGYAEGKNYSLFSNQRPLYLSFDSYISYTPYSAVYNSVSITAANLTVTTTTAHGFSVDDLVYLDFSLVYTKYDPNDSDYTYNRTYDVDKVFRVKATPAYNQFVVDNTWGDTTAATITDTLSSPTKGRRAYKILWPALDLSNISFGFANNASTVSLYDVLNADSKSYWDASANNKYLSQSAYDWMQEYLLYDLVLTNRSGRAPMTMSQRLLVDSDKIDAAYASLQPTSYSAEDPIQLNLTARVYRQAITATNGAYTSTNFAYMTSLANITTVSGNGTTVTYTANNNFGTGQNVTVTGVNPTAYNLSNVAIASANATHFTVTNAATGTYVSGGTANAASRVYLILDSVSLSTEPNIFYGDLTADYSWYDSTVDSPAQVSVQDPIKWIDIDLDNQTGSITNLDYLSFKPSRFTKSLLSQPSISTKSDYDKNLIYTTISSDYEYLHLSSGQFMYASPFSYDNTGDGFRNEAYANALVGDADSAFEIVASRDYIDGTTGLVTGGTASSLVVSYSETNGGVIESSSAVFRINGITNDTLDGVLKVHTVSGGQLSLSSAAILHLGTDATFDLISTYGLSLTVNSDSFEVNSTDVAFNSTNLVSSAYLNQQANAYFGDDTNLTASTNSTDVGMTISPTGFAILQKDAVSATGSLFVGKINYTGTAATTLVSFTINGSQVGNIQASGTGGGTISYNAFMGSHYTEFDGPAPLMGTVMETAPGLVENKYSGQNRLPKTKVSDTPASKSVYGIYFSEDADDDITGGHMIAAVGASWIRMSAGSTVVSGDLLESNGDGCARVQADDLIRSSTIGKVTSPEAVTTYEDGSYLVPCVLYCG